MKAYKGFNEDMTCRGFQYEEGKEYETDKAKICEEGFHACEMPLDCFRYYKPYKSVYHEVEIEDTGERESNTKVVGKKIKIGAKVSLKNIIDASLDFIFEKIPASSAYYSTAAFSGNYSTAASSGNYSTAASSGDYSTAASSGYYSTAASSGEDSTAASSGYYSTAASSGDYSTAASSGYKSTAASSGNYSTAASSGEDSIAASSGYKSTAASSGEDSIAASSGYKSTAASSGYKSTAASSGNYSTAIATGKNSVAVAWGYNSKTKGALGCYLVLPEFDDCGNLLTAKMAFVDGEKIKADTFYMLKNGEFIEVKE